MSRKLSRMRYTVSKSSKFSSILSRSRPTRMVSLCCNFSPSKYFQNPVLYKVQNSPRTRSSPSDSRLWMLFAVSPTESRRIVMAGNDLNWTAGFLSPLGGAALIERRPGKLRRDTGRFQNLSLPYFPKWGRP